MNDLDHIVNHLSSKTRVDPDPKSFFHNFVGMKEVPDNTIPRFLFSHRIETGMFQNIAGKQHPRLYLMVLQVADNLISCKTGLLSDCHQEAKP